MKIAVISDIHGNSWALQAVINDISSRSINTIFDLGDSLYGPLDPSGTFELLTEHNIKSLRGNQDRQVLENNQSSSNNPTLDFVRSQLSAAAIAWTEKLPPIRQIQNLFLCHGTPEKDDDYLIELVLPDRIIIKDNTILERQLSSVKENIICCGHSHRANIVHAGTKTIINPGSIGLPAYDDDQPYYHKIENYHPHARYCILNITSNCMLVEQISVPYDYEKTALCAEKNKRPDWAAWLRTGRVESQ